MSQDQTIASGENKMADTNPVQPYSGLTAAETERLALLAEECGEVVQMVGKVLRHGYSNWNPTEGADGRPNRAVLEKEIGDLLAVVDLLVAAEDLSPRRIAQARREKPACMRPWLRHQEEMNVG